MAAPDQQTVVAGKGRVGAPHDRIEGKLKVTGAARYAADFALANPLHAQLVVSTIGLGTVTAIDDTAARAVPGLRAIYSHAHPLGVEASQFFGAGGRGQQSWQSFTGPDVRFHGETVAMVVAETVIGAREAAEKLALTYDAKPPATEINSDGVTREDVPKKAIDGGDFDAEFAASDVTVSGAFETAANTHNAMELFSTSAAWNGDNVTVYVPSQWVEGFQSGIADELGIDASQVTVISPYVGGGFGGKGSLFSFTALVAAAARDLGRPVKLTVTRQQGFTVASFRAETTQDVRLGAMADGTLRAVDHTGTELTSRADTYMVAGNEMTLRMYGSNAQRARVAVAHADRQTPGFMRAPAETPYFFAFESAVDELARSLKMDPVELRLKNDIDKEPVKGVPFTSRSLKECYREAGEMFGWADYTPEVGSMRDGDELIGWGTATATYPTQMSPCSARVHVDITGKVRVEVGSHDVGTGAYTVIAQAASEMLGVPVENVLVELGRSSLPPGTIAGGSVSTASNVSTVELACRRILERLGADKGEADLADLFANYGQTAIEEYVEWVPRGAEKSSLKTLYNGKVKIVGGPMEDYTAFAFGAEYVEVRVNRFTGEIRVPRLVGAFAAGRIMNEKTARSQYLGGMIWGIGHALHEKTEIDPRTGKVVNANISEYLVPVNADIQQLDAIIVPEVDETVNPAGIKGIGEIGIVGTAAAIANAVYHATGVRVRHLPIRIEDVLPGLG